MAMAVVKAQGRTGFSRHDMTLESERAWNAATWQRGQLYSSWRETNASNTPRVRIETHGISVFRQRLADNFAIGGPVLEPSRPLSSRVD